MQGKDLAPRTAAKLGVANISDCISFQLDGSKLVARRPMYAGKCYTDWVALGSPQMATARPNVLEVVENPKEGKLEKVAFSVDKGRPTYVTKDLNLDTSGKVDLTEAEIIVSGGRGMGGPDYALIEETVEYFRRQGCGWRIKSSRGRRLAAAFRSGRPDRQDRHP